MRKCKCLYMANLFFWRLYQLTCDTFSEMFYSFYFEYDLCLNGSNLSWQLILCTFIYKLTWAQWVWYDKCAERICIISDRHYTIRMTHHEPPNGCKVFVGNISEVIIWYVASDPFNWIFSYGQDSWYLARYIWKYLTR